MTKRRGRRGAGEAAALDNLLRSRRSLPGTRDRRPHGLAEEGKYLGLLRTPKDQTKHSTKENSYQAYHPRPPKGNGWMWPQSRDKKGKA